MSGDGREIVGGLSNKEKRYPLTLSAGDIEPAEPVRPQTPQPPFSYAPSSRCMSTTSLPAAASPAR